MSIDAVSAVLRWSASELATRLVALVIAETAHRDGVGWLDQREVAERANVSVPTVKRAVVWLVEHGELEVRKVQRGRRRINVYRLLVGDLAERAVDYDRLPFVVEPPFSTRDHPETSSSDDEGSSDDATTDQPSAREKEPSLEPSKPPPTSEAARARRRDPVWDTLAAIYGEPTTRTEKTHRGKRVAEVRAALRADFEERALTPDLVDRAIRARVKALHDHWRGEADVTQDALVKHWTLATRIVETGRAAEPVPPAEKLTRWLDRVGVRLDDESDVRQFVESMANGDHELVERTMDDWRRRREQHDDAA